MDGEPDSQQIPGTDLASSYSVPQSEETKPACAAMKTNPLGAEQTLAQPNDRSAATCV